jgi:hypothetical protein
MAAPSPSPTYRIERRGSVMLVRVAGRVEVPFIQHVFTDLRRELASGKGTQILVYDASDISLDPKVIPEAQRSAKEFAPFVSAFAVVLTSATVRFAVSMVQLVSPRPIHAFERLDDALAWAERELVR